jgi:hypothetical protein
MSDSEGGHINICGVGGYREDGIRSDFQGTARPKMTMVAGWHGAKID